MLYWPSLPPTQTGPSFPSTTRGIRPCHSAETLEVKVSAGM